MASSEAPDVVLAALLRGEARDLSKLALPGADSDFVEVAETHGVDCLFRHVLKRDGGWDALPPQLKTRLDARAQAETLLELGRRGEMRRLIEEFVHANIPTLVLKGAALGHTNYPAPYLRPCSDIDLLIQPIDRVNAALRLEAMGYARVDSIGRNSVHTQSTFVRRMTGGRHVIDLHWEISNRPLFAAMLSFEELIRRAVTLPVLGQGAFTLGPVDSLLFACIHRIAHHNGSELLIWLYDIKLIAETFSTNEWERFIDLAVKKQLVAVCRETLALTAGLLGGCKEGLGRFERLRVTGEPSAAYLGGVDSRLRSLMLDLEGAAGVGSKIRLLAGHVFPDPAYMRKRYAASNRCGLIWAYVHRAGTGAWRTMRLPMDRTRIVR